MHQNDIVTSCLYDYWTSYPHLFQRGVHSGLITKEAVGGCPGICQVTWGSYSRCDYNSLAFSPPYTIKMREAVYTIWWDGPTAYFLWLPFKTSLFSVKTSSGRSSLGFTGKYLFIFVFFLRECSLGNSVVAVSSTSWCIPSSGFLNFLVYPVLRFPRISLKFLRKTAKSWGKWLDPWSFPGFWHPQGRSNHLSLTLSLSAGFTNDRNSRIWIWHIPAGFYQYLRNIPWLGRKWKSSGEEQVGSIPSSQNYMETLEYCKKYSVVFLPWVWKLYLHTSQTTSYHLCAKTIQWVAILTRWVDQDTNNCSPAIK